MPQKCTNYELHVNRKIVNEIKKRSIRLRVTCWGAHQTVKLFIVLIVFSTLHGRCNDDTSAAEIP